MVFTNSRWYIAQGEMRSQHLPTNANLQLSTEPRQPLFSHRHQMLISVHAHAPPLPRYSHPAGALTRTPFSVRLRILEDHAKRPTYFARGGINTRIWTVGNPTCNILLSSSPARRPL
ncbi:hypothetical protein CLAIMM_00481 isoform 3 [Cladophialophora immunda]|nr:hypothetical protein CLAIMM_00481 isoform 1 [Cladophialophora immunda]OQU94066.1 hypothetical protein CLAIMM_00481 isoform 2 [Cladophialophora immunda]OQU94067.1 hypothetical protein CLAIMM_00481 isoform 3 [Cladophialophora immunda]